MSDELLRALDQAGVRLTGPRREIAALIAKRNGHFTAADLIADASKRRLALAAPPSSASLTYSPSRGSLSASTCQMAGTPTCRASRHITTT